MCKKAIIALLVVGGGVWAYKHFDITFRRKDNSIEKQIAKQREALAGLDKEIRKNLSGVARREIEVKDLEKNIREVEVNQAENKKYILARRGELKADGSLTAALSDEQRQEAERELGRAVAAYKRCDSDLVAKKAKLKALKEALDAAHEELMAYQNQRRGLETELAELEAMVARLRTEEIRARVNVNSTELAELTQRNAELKQEIEVRIKEVELEGRYIGKPSARLATLEPAVDVYVEVDQLFGSNGTKVARPK